MSPRLEGIFTPTLVPLDERGRINEPEFRRFLCWLIDSGVHGLYPNGSTGEFTRFTSTERRLIGRIVCEEAHGRVPVLAGAAEANVKETLAACETYAALGARAVAIVSPFYYRLGPASVLAYFTEIAAQSPIDITMYNIPMFASPIDLPTVQRLAELPRIIGIKDSSGDIPFMMRLIAAIRPKRPDFTFLTGWEPVLAPMMMMGCDGGTHATSNVAPELTRRVFELCRAHKYDEAAEWQRLLLEFFDAMMVPYEFPDGFRAAAELRGFRMGSGRQPGMPEQMPAPEPLRSILNRVLSALDRDAGMRS